MKLNFDFRFIQSNWVVIAWIELLNIDLTLTQFNSVKVTLIQSNKTESHCIGIYFIQFNWNESNWSLFNSMEFHWVELSLEKSSWVKLVYSDSNGFKWIGLHWTQLNWI